ncbi:MAG: beta-galactosidase, partial [Lentisphaeria bacterium]|nr:beta-galactosidase [Lentisphaeria bacterium]
MSSIIAMASDGLFWKFTQGLDGWECRNFTELTIDSNGIEGRTDGNSLLVSPELDIKATDYDTMEVVLSSSTNDVFGFCIASTASTYIPEYKILKPLSKTDRLCVFRQPLNAAINWTQTIKGIQFSPSLKDSRVRILSVRFFRAGENMLFWGDMETILDGTPAEWNLKDGAKFVTDDTANYVSLTNHAVAECPFASLDRLGSFRFSVETRGTCGEALLTYFGENGNVLAKETLQCDAGDEWKECAFETTAPDFAWRAELSFQSKGEGAFQIRHAKAIRLTTAPLSSNEWSMGNDGKRTDATVRKEFPTCAIKKENGVSTLYVNGKRQSPIHAWHLGFHEMHSRNSADVAGLTLEAIDVSKAGAGFTENGFDYTKVDEILEKHYRTSPNTYFIIYMDFSGSYHQWWLNAHPEAQCKPEDESAEIGAYAGQLGNYASMSSELWRSTFEDVLRRLVRHVKESPYADRVVGFHTASGISFEWLQFGSQNRQFCDYSKCGTEDFRIFLKERYKTDEALQKAWKNAEVTLDTAKVPSTARRSAPANGIYFNPQDEQDVLDYNEYQQVLVSHCITRFGKAIKEESDGRCINGVFFGYTNYLHDMVFGGSNAGHFDARHVLDSPYVDYLIAPVPYNQRRPGAFTETMVAPQTCNINGKIFFNHVDFRHHHAPLSDYYRTDNLQESASVLYRELARNLAEGNSFQFYDFSNGWTLGDKRICAIDGKMRELFEKYRWTVKDFDKKNYLMVVVDEHLPLHFNCFQPPFERELIYNQVTYLDAAGIPWRCVLLSDLMKHPELQDYSSYLFLNQFLMDDDTMRFLKEKIMTDNRLVSFVGPVGILTPKGIDTHYAEALFGRKFAIDTTERDAHCAATSLWPSLNGEKWGSKRRDTQSYLMLPEEAAQEEIVGTM